MSTIRTESDIRNIMITKMNTLDKNHKKLIEDVVRNIPIIVNGRLKRTLGRVRYRTSTFEFLDVSFSKKYLQEAPDEIVIDTIEHEMMHILATLVYQDHCNHDSRWKELCRKYNVRDRATKKLKISL